MSSQALKEWASICGFLTEGKLIALFRKGGLADQPGFFASADGGFWLHPTHFHEQRASLREGWPMPAQPFESEALKRSGEVPIPAFCRVTGSYQIQRLDTALRYAAISPYSDEVVTTRFNYRQPGIFLHTVRVYRTLPILWVKDLPQWAGCKSFHEIDIDPREIPQQAVLDDPAYRREVLRIEEILQPTALV